MQNSSPRETLNFKIKICGVTSVIDAQFVVAHGADAIGLNFYPRSLRNVTIEQATSIRNHLDAISNTASPVIVGVFVNSTAKEINQISREIPLDFVQLHGDEPVEMMSQLKAHDIIRAIRCGQKSATDIQNEIALWSKSGACSVLLDAGSGKDYGGTGETLNWNSISAIDSSLPVILAGGLNPENVAEAIRSATPNAVDVATGVESFPGKKDPALIEEFVVKANQAFGRFSSNY